MSVLITPARACVVQLRLLEATWRPLPNRSTLEVQARIEPGAGTLTLNGAAPG